MGPAVDGNVMMVVWMYMGLFALVMWPVALLINNIIYAKERTTSCECCEVWCKHKDLNTDKESGLVVCRGCEG